MLKPLIPDESHTSIYHIDLDCLYLMGYRNILIDVDNTIVPWNSNEINPELKEWVEKCNKIGFSIYLFSNNNSFRVEKLSKSLNISAIPKGGKPFTLAFKRALKYTDGRPDNTVMIGDQIFTDILGGNLLNLYTILVDPISDKEFWGTKINRLLERLLTNRR
jgi:HAD superfamily phosphatase (TIGR01668 family)